MQLLVLVRWGAREWIRSGLAWVLGVAAVILGPACQLMTPWGIVTDGLHADGYLDAIWYLSSFFGAIVGLVLLARAGGAWFELSVLQQTAVGGLWLTAVCSIHAAAAVVLPGVLGSGWDIPFAAGLLCAGHWAALGTFIQRWPLSLTVKCVALSCLGWWLPALIAGVDSMARLHWLLDPRGHLEVARAAVDTSAGVLVDTIPLFAWWVAAALLPTRGASRR